MTKLKIDANEQIDRFTRLNTGGIVIFNKPLVIFGISIILIRDDVT